MSAVSKFARAVSLRDKGRSRSRHADSRLFVLEEGRKKLNKDEVQKVQDIKAEFARLGKDDIPESRIEYALRSQSAHGDVKEAIRLLLLYEDSVAGVIHDYKPGTKLLGAENREKTTCWLDSLLFAMFAKTDVFEAVLHQQYSDQERKKLVDALRLWVNMLRSGKLITTDITQHLQIAIAECGWPEAARLRQQDASEAFNFITDKLQLPLLTLKTDIYHQGKEDANDDHKFITERMLDVAIPDGLPQGEVLKLESCLEDYFNNRVEVKRLLARRNTVNSVASTESTEKSNMTHVETVEVDSRTSSPAPSEKQSMVPQRPANLRVRATSIFSERRVTVSTNAGATQEDESPATTRAKKEVLMPAWQFLNLIPWYTDNLPEGANQVRSHFSRKRLMLGICLKRYGMTSSGSSFRRSTHIDIPLEMASPHFTTGDQIDGDGTDAQSFKLVLKSFVCHRGHSVDAGHYISFVRIDSLKRDQHDTFTASSRERPHDQSHDAWLRFDDLAAERVVSVDINKVLKEESPYILFYRVQPIQEELPEDLPPPYQETEGQLDYVDQKLAHLEDQRRLSVEQHSARPSIEVTSPVDSQDSRGRKSLPESRRLSVLAPSVDGSIKADPVEQAPTESPSLNSTRAVSPAMSRQQTRSLRAEGRAAIDESGRRFSVTMSKLRIPNMGKEKLAASDVVVKEIAAHAQQTLVGDDEDVTKSKEKRKKLKSFKRRGSHNEGLAKPDRECIVM